MRIAWLTSSDMVPGSLGGRDDLFELELQWAALQPACAALGIDLQLRVWDAEGPGPGGWSIDDHDAVVIGTTWDYAPRVAAFLERLDRWAARVPVLNPPAVVRWNADKGYLRDLAAAGAPTVPTRWVERVDEATVADAFVALDNPHLVAKPVVGASAYRQVELFAGQSLPPADARPPGGALIQPFLPAIRDEGELSFLFCGGVLSHALRKRPAAGDYRVQSIYGGREERLTPTDADLAVARAVLDAVPGVAPADLLYARVDLVRHDGTLRVMELELIEPYLYPEQGPELGARYAASLAAALAGCSPGAAR
ncbi:MAG: hypothetical protein H6742_20315 [Alphaproteobacteria bacterium]|nr:hypothetical protein [Alphaproteobacteria bacterium]